MTVFFLLTSAWEGVINKIPCFCWGLLVIGAFLIALNLLLKYWINPYIRYTHERNLKRESFDREKEWFEKKMEKEIINSIKPSTDKGLQEEIKRLKSLLEQKEKDVTKKEEDKKMLETRLSIYEKILKQLNVNVNDNG